MREINARDFGAAGDSVTDDRPAIQRALDSGERRVYIPAGKYRICGTLVIGSGMRLRLHPEACVIFGDGSGKAPDSYIITNAPDAEGITVDGGIWEGNALNNPRVGVNGGKPYLGVLIGFNRARGLVLRNMTVRNSESFHMRLNHVKDFTVENIIFDDNIIRPNQDGVHIAGGCERGLIRNIRAVGPGTPNDDMIAFISGFSRESMGPTDPAWGQTDGDIRDIRVCGVYADNAFSFLRVFAEEYSIENITVSDVSGGCYYIGAQMQISPYLRNRGEFTTQRLGMGNIKNVRLSDWDIWRRYRCGSDAADYEATDVNALIDIEQRVDGLTIENFNRAVEKDSMPELPTLSLMNGRSNDIELRTKAGSRAEVSGRPLPDGETACERIGPEDKLEVFGGIGYLRVDKADV